MGESQRIDTILHLERIRESVALLCWAGSGTKGAQSVAILLPGHTSVIQEPWFQTLGKLTDKASRLLNKHWREVHTLANRLLEVSTMTGPEAEALIRGE